MREGEKVGLNLRLQRKIYVCVKGAKGDVEKIEMGEYEKLPKLHSLY
jgi:hypothetical protein